VKKKDRKAAITAFEDALIRHDEARRLAALERRVKELEQFPDRLIEALRAELRTMVEKP
jgi:hypothetical protein